MIRAAEALPIPDGWYAPGFDDSSWPAATEYTQERIDPKEPFFQNDFTGAKWIWSSDLALDHTVLFRCRVEKPGWKSRWGKSPALKEWRASRSARDSVARASTRHCSRHRIPDSKPSCASRRRSVSGCTRLRRESG